MGRRKDSVIWAGAMFLLAGAAGVAGALVQASPAGAFFGVLTAGLGAHMVAGRMRGRR